MGTGEEDGDACVSEIAELGLYCAVLTCARGLIRVFLACMVFGRSPWLYGPAAWHGRKQSCIGDVLHGGERAASLRARPRSWKCEHSAVAGHVENSDSFISQAKLVPHHSASKQQEPSDGSRLPAHKHD